MIYSMTGFGRGEHAVGVHVVIKSVNHRNLDVRVQLPPGLQELELEVTRWLRERLGRGRVEVRIELGGGEAAAPRLDVAVAEQAFERLQLLRGKLGVSGEVTMSDVLRAPGVWGVGAAPEVEELRGPLMTTLEEAYTHFVATRQREGDALAVDLLGRLERLSGLRSEAETRAPQRVEEYRAKLDERIAELVGNSLEVDPQRLAVEVALFADRADVAEELTRIVAHHDELRSLLEAERGAHESVGKRIDFYLQELNREVNTTASKSRDPEMTRIAIEMKSELEAMREQASNIQ